MQDRFIQGSVKVMDFIMAMLLAVMAIIVFLNVVLRYGFQSGINGTEDIARLCFIWLSFIGAVAMMATYGHLGIDILLRKLPPRPRRVAGVLGRLLMGWGLGLLLYGSWQQVVLNNDTLAMGAVAYPLSWNYAAGLFAAAGGLLCVLRDIVQLIRGDTRSLSFNDAEEAAAEHEAAQLDASPVGEISLKAQG